MHALLRQLDFHGAELAVVDRAGRRGLTDPVVARLMTIPGWTPSPDGHRGAVGDFPRSTTRPAVAYVGLNPKVRQSGTRAVQAGSQGRPAQVRVLVEAAGRPAGPGRCGVLSRIKARRGFQTAVVATARNDRARWHLVTKDQDYAFARPAWSHKRRKLELAPAPSRRGNHRSGAAYNDKQRRAKRNRSPSKPNGLPGLRRPLATHQADGTPTGDIWGSSGEG